MSSLGTLEPPNDERIYNRRQPDGTFRPVKDFFFRPNLEDKVRTAIERENRKAAQSTGAARLACEYAARILEGLVS